MSPIRPPSVLYVARHAETAFNRARRMQGNDAHTPLTRAGLAQAEAMGEALAAHFRGQVGPPVRIVTSPAGRARQTAAILAEHLGIDYFACRADARLREIEVGDWAGRLYADIVAEQGDILDPGQRLFRMPIPGGEHYADVAARLADWLADWRADDSGAPTLVVSHGITLRVLRGLLAGGPMVEGVPIAPDVPQGTIMRLSEGQETPLLLGLGASRLSTA